MIASLLKSTSFKLNPKESYKEIKKVCALCLPKEKWALFSKDKK